MSAYTFSDVLEPAGDKPLCIRARLSIRTTEEGGRRGPFTTGYRPNHNFGGQDDRIFYIGQVEVPEDRWVHPGETCELVIRFLNVRGLKDLLVVGRRWRIQEGPKHVATGEVLELLPAA